MSQEKDYRSMRKGFTLIEILVAVSIIGILSTVAIVNIPRMLESARVNTAKDAVQALRNGVMNYNMAYNKYPSTLDDLFKEDGDKGAIMDSGETVDPWGTEYKYERKGANVVITSAGPDGEFGTEDDISSKKTKSSKSSAAL